MWLGMSEPPFEGLFLASLWLRCALSVAHGSPLRHAQSSTAARGLFSCGAWAELLHGMWDLSSLTRDQTRVLCIRRRILNPGTTREVPQSVIAS